MIFSCWESISASSQQPSIFSTSESYFSLFLVIPSPWCFSMRMSNVCTMLILPRMMYLSLFSLNWYYSLLNGFPYHMFNGHSSCAWWTLVPYVWWIFILFSVNSCALFFVSNCSLCSVESDLYTSIFLQQMTCFLTMQRLSSIGPLFNTQHFFCPMDAFLAWYTWKPPFLDTLLGSEINSLSQYLSPLLNKLYFVKFWSLHPCKKISFTLVIKLPI